MATSEENFNVQASDEEKKVDQKTQEQKSDDKIDGVSDEFNEMLRHSLNELIQRVQEEFRRYLQKIQKMKDDLMERERILIDQKKQQDLEQQKWNQINKVNGENKELVEQK